MTKPKAKPRTPAKKPTDQKPATPKAVPVDAIHQSANRSIVLVAVVGLAVFVGWTEYSKRAKPTADKPDATVSAPLDDAATWSEIAATVKAGRIDTTGELLAIANVLRLNTDRLKPLIDKPTAITETNRQQILDLIGAK